MSLRSEIRLEQICFFHTGLLLFCQGTDYYLLTQNLHLTYIGSESSPNPA